MYIALAQINSIWENRSQNYDKMSEFIDKASMQGAEIIFFPEMSVTGFSMNIQVTAEYDMETVDKAIHLAEVNHIAIGVGWTKGTKDKAENHYTIINENGKIVCDYVKIHPFSYAHEDLFFRGGSKAVFFEMGGYKWSNFICYDLRFPEIFQKVSEKADVIVVPANWPQKREEHWKVLLRARAIENQCYIIGVNCVGNIGGIYYGGCSMVIAPDGAVIREGDNKESLIYAEINEDVQKIREEFPVKSDRKIQLYYDL